MFSFAGVQSEDAANCFSRLLERVPDSELGHLGLGMKALQEGKYEDAIKNLERGQYALQQSTSIFFFTWHILP